MKKLWAILLAMMLVLSMVTVASAEGTDPAEGDMPPVEAVIEVPNNGHTYEILQIFTGDLHEKDGSNVLSNLVWGFNGNGTAGKAVPEETIKELKKQTGEVEVRDYIVKNLLNSLSPYATIGKVNGEYVGSDRVEPGYYLIRDKADTLTGTNDSYTFYIVKITGFVTITPKANTPSLVKKIKDTNDTTGVTSEWQDSADYDIGDEVPYLLEATVASNYASYKGAYKLVFHDTMEAGLTFNENSVKVLVGTKEVDATEVDKASYKVAKTDDQNFTVTIDDLKALLYGENNMNVKAGDKIYVEFTATLNENANIGAKGNLNTAYLEFANNPNSEQPEMGKTPDDTVIAFTYQVVINKVKENGESLTGADFKLEKQIGPAEWVEVERKTVDTAGTVFTFKGLDDGTYRLTETKVPDGYNKMADVLFTVTADHRVTVVELNVKDDSRYTVLESLSGSAEGDVITLTAPKETETNRITGDLTSQVVNKSGATLPETGGIGTTIFYVLGGMMFVGAALILVVRRKAEADEI